MPDLSDLHEAFARLEQQIPDGYRSPLVEQRLTRLLEGGTTVRALPRPRRRGAGPALLAAAAVVVLAVAVALVRDGPGGHDGRAPAGSGAPTGPSAPVSASTSPPARPTTPPVTALPADAAALVRFVAGGAAADAGSYRRGAYRPGQALQPTPGRLQFTTPSGNIACGLVESARPSLDCDVARHSWADQPRSASCGLDWAGGALGISGGAVVRGRCAGNPVFPPISAPLPYGSSLRAGSVACRSDAAFLACADLDSGRGFAVSRGELRTYP